MTGHWQAVKPGPNGSARFTRAMFPMCPISPGRV
jgi:hypothetical protein